MAGKIITKKNSKRLIYLAVAAVVISLGLYFFFIRESAVPVLPETGVLAPSIPDVDVSLLGEVLDQFSVWQSLPVIVGPTGKTNPFSP